MSRPEFSIGEMTTLTLASSRLREPHTAALVSVGSLTLLGWAVLMAEALGRGGGADAFLDALCRPMALSPGAGIRDLAEAFAVSAGSWIAMSVAMMLPTATAMVVAYADLSVDRRSRGEAVFSPWLIVAGYLSVWIVVSIGFALVQTLTVEGVRRLAVPAGVTGIVSGLLVSLAGLYQFSTWKSACLVVAHDPSRSLDQAWRNSRRGVLGMGVRQGLRCLGCCGPLMGVMLLMGAMNLVWMIAFSILMAVEKLVATRWLVYGIGAVLMGLGLLLSLTSAGWRWVPV